MKKRVLVLNCGTLASTSINKLLRDNDEFEIWGASTIDNHGRYIYKRYIGDIPCMFDERFIEVLNQKIEEFDFKFIFPQHDDLALFMQENKSRINATVVSSPYDTALLCRYKSKLYQRFMGYDFVPNMYGVNDVIEYPVFMKMDNDQGGKHAYIINDSMDLEYYNNKYDNMITCEYLPGEEVTIDCFTDRNRRLLVCLPRGAERILAGIDVHSSSIENYNDLMEIEHIANSLNTEIIFRGYWFFQVKRDKEGKYKLLEISTRFAGSFDYTESYDINMPLMALKDFDNQDVTVNTNNLFFDADKQFFSRFFLKDNQGNTFNYDNLVIDIDCFRKERINPFLIALVYQEKKKRKIILFGDNIEDIKKTLENNSISSDLFEIADFESVKNEKNSIFISNNEQLKNTINCKYHFSDNNVEVLIDWKG